MGVSIEMQQVLYDRLSSDGMFNGALSANGAAIPIIQEVKGDVKNQVTTALAKLGVCVVLLVPTFQLFDPYLWSTAGWMRFGLDVFEDVLFNANSTRVKAPDICERILSLMQKWPTGSVHAPNGETATFRGNSIPWQYVAIGPPVHYTVNLQAEVLLPQSQP
jgi:hypothetical protein